MAEKKPKTGRTYADSEATHAHTALIGEEFVVVRHSHAWRPPTDVFEDDGRLIIVIEIAGMQKGKFSVILDKRNLTISGSRPPLTNSKPAFYQLEVRHGEFRVDVDLPWAIDDGNVEAFYDDGFLRIELPPGKSHAIPVVDVANTDA